jgi:glycerophosphoryl diester phosphodiesterase
VFDRPPPLIAHRGMGMGVVEEFTENTLASFLGVVERGAPWIEVDVRRTADDTLLVCHDPSYADATFLADIDVTEARARGTLFLEDLLAELPDGIGIYFDLKPCTEDAIRPPAATTAGLLAPIIHRELQRRPAFVCSLDAGSLRNIGDLQPDVPRGLLTPLWFPADQGIAAAAHLGVDLVAMHDGSLAPSMLAAPHHLRAPEYTIELAHQAGLEMLVWCPDVDGSRSLLAAGADALCVNDLPAIAAGLA